MKTVFNFYLFAAVVLAFALTAPVSSKADPASEGSFLTNGNLLAESSNFRKHEAKQQRKEWKHEQKERQKEFKDNMKNRREEMREHQKDREQWRDDRKGDKGRNYRHNGDNRPGNMHRDDRPDFRGQERNHMGDRPDLKRPEPGHMGDRPNFGGPQPGNMGGRPHPENNFRPGPQN